MGEVVPPITAAMEAALRALSIKAQYGSNRTDRDGIATVTGRALVRRGFAEYSIRNGWGYFTITGAGIERLMWLR